MLRNEILFGRLFHTSLYRAMEKNWQNKFSPLSVYHLRLRLNFFGSWSVKLIYLTKTVAS